MGGVLCLDTQPIAGMGKAVSLKGAQPALKGDSSCHIHAHTQNLQ